MSNDTARFVRFVRGSSEVRPDEPNRASSGSVRPLRPAHIRDVPGTNQTGRTDGTPDVDHYKIKRGVTVDEPTTATRPGWSTAWDPNRGERLRPAWVAITKILSDDHWHDFIELVEAGLEVSDLQVKTVRNLVTSARRAGIVSQRGAYKRATHTDFRQIRIVR